MAARFTATELKELVHRFYPARLEGNDPRHERSEEFHRLLAACEAAMGDTRLWDSFFQRLRETATGCIVENWSTLRYDACRRCRVYLPATTSASVEMNAVVGLVSVIAPVFAIYGSRQTWSGQKVVETRIDFPPLPVESQGLEATLDSLIRSSFGFERLSNDILFTPVRELQVGHKAPGNVQLVDCLFTDNIW